MDQNLAWLTQKTEDPKSNKENLTFSTHTKYDWTENNKKVVTPPPYVPTMQVIVGVIVLVEVIVLNIRLSFFVDD